MPQMPVLRGLPPRTIQAANVPGNVSVKHSHRNPPPQLEMPQLRQHLEVAFVPLASLPALASGKVANSRTHRRTAIAPTHVPLASLPALASKIMLLPSIAAGLKNPDTSHLFSACSVHIQSPSRLCCS